MSEKWKYPMTVSTELFGDFTEMFKKRDISYMGKEWNEEFERLSQKAAERRDRELRERYIKEVTEANHAVEANEEIDQFVGLWKIAGLEYDVSWKHKNAKGKYVPRKYIARPTGDYGVIREYVKDELLKYGRKKTLADFEGLSWNDISDKAKEFIRSRISDDVLQENLQKNQNRFYILSSDDVPSNPELQTCPHPEWLGVWEDKAGYGAWVKWEFGLYWVKKIGCEYLPESNRWTGPLSKCWTQIEPAPLEARAHTKPKQKLSIGWDPYDLG